MILGALGATRDVFIVLWAFLSVMALIFIILAALAIWAGVKDILKTVKATVNEDVKPILTVSQDTVNNVAGTTRFVSDTVAKPVIRGLSFIAGARRALSVFTGISGRGRG